jgi:hypothetical protein
VDRDRIVAPRHGRASKFHRSCRTLGRWFSDYQSAFVGYSPRAYQRWDSMMTEHLTGNGQRWGQRIAVEIPVQVAAHASPAIHGHLKNVSLSGALVEADHELRLHAYIEISIRLTKTGCSVIRVMARVTRKLTDAVGVEWCEFAPSDVKDLLRSPSIPSPL